MHGEQGTLGRKTQSEVVLTRHLRMAMKRLNAWMTDKQLAEAVARQSSSKSVSLRSSDSAVRRR